MAILSTSDRAHARTGLPRRSAAKTGHLRPPALTRQPRQLSQSLVFPPLLRGARLPPYPWRRLQRFGLIGLVALGMGVRVPNGGVNAAREVSCAILQALERVAAVVRDDTEARVPLEFIDIAPQDEE